MPLDWHPRYCDTRKTYEYRILNRRFAIPTERLYSHFFYYPLDVEKMQQAADYFGWTRVSCVRDGKLRSIEDIHEELYARVKSSLEEV